MNFGARLPVFESVWLEPVTEPLSASFFLTCKLDIITDLFQKVVVNVPELL
jgi:hypothetical protein